MDAPLKAHTKPLIPIERELSTASSLNAAVTAFNEYMVKQGFSANTIKAFNGDLSIFLKYLGAGKTIGDISSGVIGAYLNYLRYERGVPCTPKSYQRRLTTLKVFFGYLHESKIIPLDPAAPIPHIPVASPLPEVLNKGQVEQLLTAARSLRDAGRSDARPHLIITLVLTTGIKKSECMAIRLKDIDLSDAERPALWIRYEDPRRRHKERKLKLPADFGQTLAAYREQYQVQDLLFECTARNLEYVLADTARLAGLGDTVSFESLRWSSAVRDLQGGMREETLRQKLGLSSITWQETGEKIKRLAAAPL
jgi:integrase/recombinase XerD